MSAFHQNLQHKLRGPLGRANALDVFERVPLLNKFDLIYCIMLGLLKSAMA